MSRAGAGAPLRFGLFPLGLAGGPDGLAAIARLTATGQPWDLVLAYRDRGRDLDGWERFVADVVAEHGAELEAIQVTGEANLTHVPDAADGAYPGATEAFVRGVRAAIETKRRTGATAAIGFAVVPDFEPATSECWAEVGRLGATEFAGAVDYAGLRSPARRVCRAAGMMSAR